MEPPGLGATTPCGSDACVNSGGHCIWCNENQNDAWNEGFPDWLGKTIYYVVPNLQNFDLKTRAVYGDALPLAVLVDLTAYAAAYIAALLALAALAFRRRDLK